MRRTLPTFLFVLVSAVAAQEVKQTHWSLLPIDTRPAPVSEERHPIEAFLSAARTRVGLTRRTEADRRTLMRRATFALHGLPPTPAEIDAFLGDARTDAYERLIDRLLASPRYGERWARHWLDVVHYGDTHGFDKDKVRPNAWPYRDWVIRALNADMPWRRFVEMQLAGDILHPDDPDGIVATGFIAAGPWDYVGHVELREGTVDKKITRDLDRDDMVTNAMSSFTSLTVHCARCHDHKFDPITQAEYFALQSVFAGVERADRPYDSATTADSRRKLEDDRDRLNNRLKELPLEKTRSETIDRLTRALDSQRRQLEALPLPEPPTSPTNGWHSAIKRHPLSETWVEIDLGRDHAIRTVHILAARPTDFKDTPGFGFPLRFTVSVRADGAGLPQRTIASFQDRDFMNPGDAGATFPSDGAPVRFIRVTGHKLWKRYDDYVMAFSEWIAFADSGPVSHGVTVRSSDSIEAGRWGRKHLVDGFTSQDRVGHVRPIYRQRADVEEIIRALTQGITDTYIAQDAAANPGRARERNSIRVVLESIEKRLAALPKQTYVYAAAPRFKGEGQFRPAPEGPRPVQVLERGDVTRPRAAAVPAGPSCVQGVPSVFPGDLAAEGNRRAALARWITHRNHPLTWRSIVNRVWHHHFGRGLVTTPNDFGRMGARPSHPQLLDWLADQLRDGDGSLKDLHFLILTSPTWKQRSDHHDASAKVDAGNRWLWRAPRRRLEAEAVRDAILYVAGTLDLTMGGPGYRAFGFKDDHSPHYLYEDYDPSDRSTWRRTIYRLQVRSVPDPFLETMDCPDPSRSVPVRAETMTPLQALALLNDRFMLEHARHLARRIKREAASTAARIDRAFALTLGRRPSADERNGLVNYADRYGLPAMCRLLFNLNEFLFID